MTKVKYQLIVEFDNDINIRCKKCELINWTDWTCKDKTCCIQKGRTYKTYDAMLRNCPLERMEVTK